MNTVIHVPDVFGYLASKVDSVLSTGADPFRVYFDYGPRTEMNKKLMEKDASMSSKEKYPLIWLHLPFTVLRESDTGNYGSIAEVNLFIIEFSDPTSTSQERKVKTFDPRLYPIYVELLNQFEKSSYFDVGTMKHLVTDLPYFDGRDGKTQDANLFGDYLDVIQLNVKNLNVNETVCDRFQLIGA